MFTVKSTRFLKKAENNRFLWVSHSCKRHVTFDTAELEVTATLPVPKIKTVSRQLLNLAVHSRRIRPPMEEVLLPAGWQTRLLTTLECVLSTSQAA